MCEIINFPQDQTARAEKIKYILDKKIKKTIKTPPMPSSQISALKKSPARHASLKIAGIAELTACINDMNCILKYINDSSYRQAKAINNLTVAIYASILAACVLVGLKFLA